jgi:chemotaxis protein histidine kinase CheA
MMLVEIDAFPTKIFEYADTEVDDITLNDEHSIVPECKTKLKSLNKKKNDKLLKHQAKLAKEAKAKALRETKAAEQKAAKAQKKERMERRIANNDQGGHTEVRVVVGALARIWELVMEFIDFMLEC